MARVILDGTIKGLSGRMGDLIFRQLPDGTTQVTLAPRKKNSRQKKRAWKKRSPAQKAHNKRFQEAVHFASASQTQPVYAGLAAAAPMRTAYSFALSDCLKPPEVQRIERRGSLIRVQARDNIGVTRVRVTVLDGPDGSVLERGEAVRKRGNWWEYRPQTGGKTIVAEAWDLPENMAQLTVTLR